MTLMNERIPESAAAPAVPLSGAQLGVWVTEHTLTAGSAFHLPLVLHFDGPLDTGALSAACAAAVRIHPALAGAIPETDGMPALESSAVPSMERRDVTGVTGTRLRELLREASGRPFDLQTGPLARFTLFRAGARRHALLVTAHRLVFDGASMEVLVDTLAAAYRPGGRRLGAPAPRALGRIPAFPSTDAFGPRFPPAGEGWTSPASDSGPRWARHRDEPEHPDLPGLLPAYRSVPGAGTTPGPGTTVPFRFGPRTVERLAVTAAALGVTHFELLLAAWHCLLFRYGNPRVRTAVPLSTRELPRDARTVGAFANELPVCSHPLPGEPFGGFARELRAELRAVHAFRAVPFGHTVRGVPPRTTTAPLSVGYVRHVSTAEPAFDGLTTSVQWVAPPPTARGTAHLELVEGPDSVEGALHVRTDAFAPGAAARIPTHLATLLTTALADPSVPVGDLPLLPEPEYTRVVHTGNAAESAAPEGTTVAGLFAARVREAPDAVAVVDGDRAVTYGQLAAAAWRLAARLRAAGVGAGSVVAVDPPAGPEGPAALLGVLAAGAVCAPHGPGPHRDRPAGAAPDAFVTGRGAPGDFAPEPVTDTEGLCAGPPARPHPDDPACVAYGTGPRGVPTGCEIPHRALADLLTGMRGRLGAGPADRWLAAGTAGRGAWIVETLLPLTTGGRIVLAPHTGARPDAHAASGRGCTTAEGAALRRTIERHDVTHLQAGPATWRALLGAGLARPGLTALVRDAGSAPLSALRRAVGTVVGVYGSAADAVWTLSADLTGEAAGADLLGTPLPGVRAYVLDARSHPVPEGIAGTLHLGGVGVAHGRPAEPGPTAGDFPPDPFGVPGDRLCRTGDTVRLLPGGALERAGEPSARPAADPAPVRPLPASGGAAVTGGNGGNGDTPRHIGHGRRGTGRTVRPAPARKTRTGAPAGMFRGQGPEPEDAFLDHAPAPDSPGPVASTPHRGPRSVTTTGETGTGTTTTPSTVPETVTIPDPGDRPTDTGTPTTAAQDTGATATGIDTGITHITAPKTATPNTAAQDTGTAATLHTHSGTAAAPDGVVEVVREVWREVLGVDDIAPGDDLFALGGHSLAVARIAAGLHVRLGVRVPLPVFFDTPTVGGVAASVARLLKEEE